MPKVDKGPDPDADVPERLRKVKLSKRRARFVDTQGTAVLLVILLFLAGSFVLIHHWWERRQALWGE